MPNILPLFAFGESLGIYLTVVLLISTCAFIVSLVNVTVWAILSRFLTQIQLGKIPAFVAMMSGTIGGLLYMFLYDERRGFWLLPAVAGACVLTTATLTALLLIRIDGDWPRIKLKTLLALVAVSAVVLATIAPAFHAP